MPTLRLCHGQSPLALLTAWTVLLIQAATSAPLHGQQLPSSSRRNTPVVRAVRNCAASVVNIQGQKSVAAGVDAGLPGPATRQVNGMGTGVVIDPRGYVLTNFHVVDGVRQINVTLANGRRYIAQLIAHDRETDLAVIRIRTPHALPVIEIGTSADLMAGESVVAVGNAYGYEHTVTTGIISALHRNVQVNDTQKYLDLIQTDASINPGNSGGPLLNIDGEMIGVNVAVRAGAQGIGFAIPVDKALDVAAHLVSIERLDKHWHGIRTTQVDRSVVEVADIAGNSPANKSGIRRGDRLSRIGGTKIQRAIDVERALLGRDAGESVSVEVVRDGRTVEVDLRVAALGGRSSGTREVAESSPTGAFDRLTWQTFGLVLEAEQGGTLRRRGVPFNGGMRVVRVRDGSMADEQGVVAGDVLVRIHRWYTTSEQDVRYVLNRRHSISKIGPVRFDIVRGQEHYYGRFALSGNSADRG